MAVRIRNFPYQEMRINTPFSLNIRITGNPSNVRVDGIPDGLYYHWNANRNRVQIRGTPETLVYHKEMLVVADNKRRRQLYSVIPFLPSFDQNIRQDVIKGVPFTLPVMVESTHASTEVEGPYVGVSWDITPDGFFLYGTIPENANFTIDAFVFNAAVSNFSGVTRGTITLTPQALGDTRFYFLDGDGSVANTKIKEYPVIPPPSEGLVQQPTNKRKEILLPDIPGTTANYVAIANDGTNLLLLHSRRQGDVTNRPADLDDQVVVVSPTVADGQRAGIIRRFSITRHSSFYNHELEDLYYYNGKVYLLTSYVTNTEYSSYFVLYTEGSPHLTRVINLLARGGGIAVTGNLLTALLFDRNSPNQGNYFRVYPPSWLNGMPLIADSGEVYTTYSVVRSAGGSSRDLSLASLNNLSYILSSTLTDVVSVVELLPRVNRIERRNEIGLSPALSQPQGITIL